jgi:hypothetical protein
MTIRFYIFLFIGFTSSLIVSCDNNKSSINRNDIHDSIPLPPPPPPSPNDTLKYRAYLNACNCIYTGKLNPHDRIKTYPFNTASKVLLVSYKAETISLDDSTTIYEGSIPKENEQIDFKKFKETIILSKTQIDTLTDIIFNYNYQDRKLAMTEHSTCDFPTENAILFLDINDSCFAYVELCFSCDDYKLNPDSLDFGDFCSGKFLLIKDFISRQGIHYGLNPKDL